MQVAQWASIYPYLLHERMEDVLPSDSASWLCQALQTIRDRYPYHPHQISVEVQVLLWQAKEELGDLLLQVVFHAVIAGEGEPGWDVDDVAAGITEKLIRRNPHVFGDSDAVTIDEIAAQWERIKAEEKRGR